MPKETKYGGERLQFVIDKLKEDKTITLPSAVKLMCAKYQLKYTDSARRSIAAVLARKGVSTNDNTKESENFKKAAQREIEEGKDTFIISWAQNATPIHKGFFKNMKAYSEHLGAELLVIAGRYRNPTSVFTDKDQDWWPRETLPYLDANRHNIHKYLQVLSDVKTSPTASTPLSGFNGVTGLESCIIGHPRQHLKCLPVLDGYPNKLLLSTGACTVENYTDSKSGKKGNFHHSYGFVIVELDGKDFHVRQVTADNKGNFYDLFNRVKNGEVLENTEGCEAAILGDIHIQHNNKEATDVSFELLDRMKPKHTMIHDIIDCESISHWDTKDPFKMMEKEETGRDNFSQELKDMILWVEKRLKYNLVVVRSNHDDFLDRWLKFSDWRKIGNKKLYLELAYILANEEVAKREGVIPFLIQQSFGDRVKTLSLDDSYRVLGWELGMHGHVGANGSRGSHTQYKNMNTKNVTGHCHHPHKEDGHLSVGTLTDLRVGYNKGPSNWMHSNVLIYPDGKAQHIHIINGKYCR